MKFKLLFILGTRPEAIKLAPIIHEARKYKKNIKVTVCLTGQHDQLVSEIIDFFHIEPDFNLRLMKKNQTLFELTSNSIKVLGEVIHDVNPDLVFVQGDTTTAFISSLSAYYSKTKIAHVEAGLRSKDKYSPFPEEMNRILISHIADYHFAPTEKSKTNLYNEGIKDKIYVVGNTVIDALNFTIKNLKNSIKYNFTKKFRFIEDNKKLILVTGHRRESFGKPFENICNAIKKIAYNNKMMVNIIYPVHLNPNVRKPVYDILKNIDNVHLIEPVNYPEFVWLMNRSYLILTDSGGIQEEAPTLKKPVLIMREVTERIEIIENNLGKLVGTDIDNIVMETQKLLDNQNLYKKMSTGFNPYGDGKSSKRIMSIIMNEFS